MSGLAPPPEIRETVDPVVSRRISHLLDLVGASRSEDEKREVAEELFEYLVAHQAFVFSYPNFRASVVKKLRELASDGWTDSARFLKHFEFALVGTVEWKGGVLRCLSMSGSLLGEVSPRPPRRGLELLRRLLVAGLVAGRVLSEEERGGGLPAGAVVECAAGRFFVDSAGLVRYGKHRGMYRLRDALGTPAWLKPASVEMVYPPRALGHRVELVTSSGALLRNMRQLEL